MGIAKPCTHLHQLHPPPPAYFNLHPAPSTSIQLISTSTQLSATSSEIFELKFLKFLFGQIWAKKVKVVRFVWKIVHMVPSGCWFLFWHYFSEFQNLNLFLRKFSLKKSNYQFLLKIGTETIMRMLILIPTLVLPNLKPKSLGYWFLFWE